MSMDSDRFTERYISERIRELPQREPPPDMVRRIMAGIPAEKGRSLSRSKRPVVDLFTGVFRTWRFAGAVGVLALTFWLGMMTGGQMGTAPEQGEDGQEKPVSAFSVRTAESGFFMGRGLLAAGKWKEALPFFREAVLLAPDNPEYALWLGVALGMSGDTTGEMSTYRETLERYPGFVPARLYLGHLLLENGQPDAALAEYSRVLELVPDEETALYNRALAGKLLGKKEEAAADWHAYLNEYRTGRRAFRAVQHLNEMGDFSFRTYQIGYRKVILNQELLLEDDTPGQQAEIELLADSFRRGGGDVLELVVFRQGDPLRAGTRARELKQGIVRLLAGTHGKEVRTSWFGEPERVRTVSGKWFVLDESLLIFSKPRQQQEKEKRI
ncbi:MAG: hypothetical protein Kow0089_12360 [Desulfobulbaceae bacterium]